MASSKGRSRPTGHVIVELLLAAIGVAALATSFVLHDPVHVMGLRLAGSTFVMAPLVLRRLRLVEGRLELTGFVVAMAVLALVLANAQVGNDLRGFLVDGAPSNHVQLVGILDAALWFTGLGALRIHSAKGVLLQGVLLVGGLAVAAVAYWMPGLPAPNVIDGGPIYSGT